MDLRDQITINITNTPGFDEIDSYLRHYVITDIVTRFQVIQTMWSDADRFVENYINWVYMHITLNTRQMDPVDMWETWGKMLKQLYMGI